IAGGSRTGKTYTALRMARGIAGPEGKIAAIDTEGKRMSHYSKEFSFDVFNMKSPFSPLRFSEAAKGAEEAGYAALVIDSFSLEWSGVGGVLNMHEEHFAKANYNQKLSDVCWARAKAPHKRMKDELMQLTIPIIFCLRTNEVPDHLGGGWKIDQDKRFLYEWTVGLTLHPDTPGKPRYDLVDAKKKPLWKVQEQHLPLFPEGELIGEEAGAALQAWRNSSDARSAGSGAVGVRRTMADWLADLEEDLSLAITVEAVETRMGRDDVQQILTRGKDTHKSRVNALISAALDRVQDDVPEFAAGAAPAAQEGEAA
ncbi:MAG: hypothetical protein JWM33_391, partial [Caulobacteraceae bacterium]|nr:hypothetical protein [Caulobacteraceae bacterium]